MWRYSSDPKYLQITSQCELCACCVSLCESPLHGGMWPREGGGCTHPGSGYQLQIGPRELWLSMQSRLEKGGLSLTQVLSEERVCVGGRRGGAVREGLLCAGRSFWPV